jgi:excisionase family DNA binding protein
MNKYLHKKEAAPFLGITEKALEHHISRGRVPFRKLGRRVIFLREELEEFMNSLPGMRLADVRKRWGNR